MPFQTVFTREVFATDFTGKLTIFALFLNPDSVRQKVSTNVALLCASIGASRTFNRLDMFP